MRPVAVIGIGKTAFGAFPDRDLRSSGLPPPPMSADPGRKNGVRSVPRPGSALIGGGGRPEVLGGCPRKSFTNRSLLPWQLRGAVFRGSKPFGPVHCRRYGDYWGAMHTV